MATSSARYFRESAVPRYDPKIRDYVLLADGNIDSMHPVDQRVALTLNILQGTLSGDSTLGNALKAIQRLGGEFLQADIKRIVTTALEDIINDGEISLVDITVTFPKKGEMSLFIKYKNEILSQSLQPQTQQITIGGN